MIKSHRNIIWHLDLTKLALQLLAAKDSGQSHLYLHTTRTVVYIMTCKQFVSMEDRDNIWTVYPALFIRISLNKCNEMPYQEIKFYVSFHYNIYGQFVRHLPITSAWPANKNYCWQTSLERTIPKLWRSRFSYDQRKQQACPPYVVSSLFNVVARLSQPSRMKKFRKLL